MRKAKGLSFLLALMLLVTTACSSDPGSASSGGGSQSVSTESNPSGSSTPSESEQVTLNIILMETAFVQALEPLIPEFEQEFGIKVNYEVGGQEIQRQRMYLDLSGESGQIDVVHLSNSYVQDWVQAGWLEALDPYIEQDASEVNMSDFIASSVEAFKFQDQIWGLPIMSEVALMAYRKDILDKYGVQPPETWDDIAELGELMRAANDPVSTFAMRANRGQGANMFVFPMFIWSYGGGFYRNPYEDMTPILNSSENVQALERFSTLLQNYGPDGYGNIAYPDIITNFSLGNLAITVDGTSVIAQLIDTSKSDFAEDVYVAQVPAGPNGRFPANASHGLLIPASSYNKEAAWKFLKWATSTEIQKKLALSEVVAYADITRESAASDPEVLARYNNKDFANQRLEALKAIDYEYRPLTKEWIEIADNMSAYVNAAINNEMDAQSAMEKAQEETENTLKQAGYDISE